MTALSLRIPDTLARESSRIARTLGISRTELIRRALEHELARLREMDEVAAMQGALRAMAGEPGYLAAAEEWEAVAEEPVVEEGEEWWKIPST